MQKEGESTLREALGEFTKSKKIKKGYKQVIVQKFWEQNMGKMINSYTKKLYVTGDVLYVTIDSSPLKQELDLGRDKVLTMINNEFGEDYISKLVLR